MRPATEWTEEDVRQLVTERYEESLELEFKRSDALADNDKNKKKNDISKDVSAFANSQGGTVVYGIQETKDKPRRAEAVSPIDPTKISKEWLDQVINSRIHPRLAGVIINPIELKTSHPGKVVYAVFVPQSTTAHQASDKKYYKRFNFEAVPMEDYEVRQTMARVSRPSYTFSLVLENPRPSDNDDRFYGVLENKSDIVAHDVSAILFVPKWWVRIPQEESTFKFDSIEYSRIPGTFQAMTLAKSVAPFVSKRVDFHGAMRLPRDYLVLERPILFVRIYDSFGLASSPRFRFIAGRGLVLLEGGNMPGRSQSPIANGTLSDY